MVDVGDHWEWWRGRYTIWLCHFYLTTNIHSNVAAGDRNLARHVDQKGGGVFVSFLRLSGLDIVPEVTFTFCNIYENAASQAGGLYIQPPGQRHSIIVNLVSTTISMNTADGIFSGNRRNYNLLYGPTFQDTNAGPPLHGGLGYFVGYADFTVPVVVSAAPTFCDDGTFLNTTTNTCQISCAAASGRRLTDATTDGEQLFGQPTPA